MTGPEPDRLMRNRANWDDRTRVHAASAFYDLPGFRAGASTLRPVELAEAGDVSGLDLLHLQCEFLHEYDTTYFPRFTSLADADGSYRFPPDRPRIPLLYSLRAVRTGNGA